VVAWDENGRPDFDRLAPRLQRSTREPKPPVAYHVFDVLVAGGVDRLTPGVRRVLGDD
jgi:ATP-dependent DNA ligase